ncbi:CBS domain-containing protein [Sphingopyxis sp. R3-92]|uniref:CBS domain-containing protein n=1 Tax=Sphingopyxis sp. R3-92 TaxID=3158553 RepID=UPI003EE5C853
MTIGAILRGRTGPVISARKEDLVRTVVDLLAQNRIGAVPVLENDMIIGIFSERDLVRLMSSYGPDALDHTLDEVMTKSPVTCDSQMAVIGALSQMTQKRIRHLPVVDNGRLVGFISIGDLVKYRIDRIEAEAAAMRDYITGAA